MIHSIPVSDKIYEQTEYEYLKKDTESQVMAVRMNNKKRVQTIVVHIDEHLGEPQGEIHVRDIRTGNSAFIKSDDILGTIKAECLSEKDRIFLAMIKPLKEPFDNSLGFSGYCYLKDGRYQGPVYLDTIGELEAYIKLQMKYQYRVIVCDSGDCIILDIEDGHLKYPDPETLLEMSSEE